MLVSMHAALQLTLLTGSFARLVNHSCSPNMGARIIRGKAIFRALRTLSNNEELTIKSVPFFLMCVMTS